MRSTCSYTGDWTDTCPISLANVRELQHPVVLLGDDGRCDVTQPFECEMLMEWLLRTRQHPISRKEIKTEDIIPLLRCENDHVIAIGTWSFIDKFGEDYEFAKVVVKPPNCAFNPQYCTERGVM